MVTYLKECINSANNIYTSQLKRNAEYEQRRKEEIRLAEIRELEKENQLNLSINNILNELI